MELEVILTKLKEEKSKILQKNSSKNKKFGELISRISEYFKPKTTVELGTSLGISTLYLSSPNPKATLYTLEGCPETLNIAKKNLQKQGLKILFQFLENSTTLLNHALKK